MRNSKWLQHSNINRPYSMSNDFTDKRRPRAATRLKPESRVPGWVWLFTGTALGAFIMFLMHLSDMPASDPEPPSTAVSPETGTGQQPRFDFYKLLKEAHVPVFEEKKPDETETAPAKEEPGQYLLQVASFKGAGDAENLRAKLILLNLDAHVETATVRNGEIWHRVLVGPFDSRSNLAKARSILASNQLEALILKRAPKG